MKYLLVVALLVLPIASFAYTCPGAVECEGNGKLTNQWGSAPRFWNAPLGAWYVDITGTQAFRDHMTRTGHELYLKGFCGQFPSMAQWCR